MRMANKKDDIFFLNSRIPSTELRFINGGIFNQVRNLVLDAFPPSDIVLLKCSSTCKENDTLFASSAKPVLTNT
jgi:hypothetical protein